MTDPLAERLDKLDGSLAGLGLGLDHGWLVIFDRRAGQPPIAVRNTSHAATSRGPRDPSGAGLSQRVGGLPRTPRSRLGS